MAVKKQRSRRSRTSRHQGSMKIISVILLLVCGSMGVQIWQIDQQIEQYALVEEDLKQQIIEEEENQKAIEAQAAYRKTDAYIEDLAREKLGLIYDNEIILKKQRR